MPNELLELLGGESINALEFVSIDPANNSVDVQLDQSIVLTFNNKIETLSYTLLNADGDVIDSQLTISDNVATIIPQQLNGGKNYILVVTSVRDIYSQSLGRQVYKFTTIA